MSLWDTLVSGLGLATGVSMMGPSGCSFGDRVPNEHPLGPRSWPTHQEGNCNLSGRLHELTYQALPKSVLQECPTKLHKAQ